MFLIFMSIIPQTIIGVSTACEDEDNVVSSLQQLKEDILNISKAAFKDSKCEKTVLYNKIDAVIKQVMAGAFKGSLNKLKNDIEKRIKRKIVNPWKEKLLDQIRQIICLIKELLWCHPPVDSEPPMIHEILYYPDAPEYDDYVLVLAHVTDCKSEVANVTLSYSVNSGKSINLTMQKMDDLYAAKIPPQPYNANVTFYIYAFDTAGNMAESSTYFYIVSDSDPPVISYIERIPANPNYNETVFIYVNATEPPLASGIEKVILSYSNGTRWINRTMDFDFQKGLYVTEVPAFSYGTLVKYVIYVFDYASNVAITQVYSYRVDDRFLPVATLDAPKYVSNTATITLYVYDDNLYFSKLTVNGKLLDYFNQSGAHQYVWNVTEWPDGAYLLRLDAYDAAGNHGWAECQIIIDKTAPTVGIEWPQNQSYVRGLVSVKMIIEDSNIEKAELTIDSVKYAWKGTGIFTYVWETSEHDDGWHILVLRASDLAGNENHISVRVFVDNTAPSISNLTWKPSEPLAGENVNVSVQVLDYGSGIKNVTLWFRTDKDTWRPLNMTFENGNWTCTIPEQEKGRIVLFYIECYDNLGNCAKTMEQIYIVGAAPTQRGFPLSWLLLIIVAIGISTALTTYYYRLRKRKRAGKTLALISLK